jgi:hypothetical protein
MKNFLSSLFMKEIYGGCFDSDDDRDFLGSEISDVKLTDVADLPSSLEFDRKAVTLESQGKTNSCTAQAAGNCLELTYYNFFGNRIRVFTDEIWRYQLDIHPRQGSENMGDYLRSPFRAMVHMTEHENRVPATYYDAKGRIAVSNFAKIDKDPDIFRQWLYAGFAIAVSGNVLKNNLGTSNWYRAKKEGYLSFPEGWNKVGGHAVCVVTGYDFSTENKYFIIGQSYGENYGVFKNGTIRIRAEEIQNLNPSCFICFPEGQNIKQEKVKAAKDIVRAKKIFAIAEIFEWDPNEAALFKNNAHKYAEEARRFLRS